MVQCSASVFWLGAYLKKGSMARMRTHYKPNDTGIIWDIWCKLKMLSTFTTPCQFHIYSYGKKSCVFVNKSSIHGPCSTANCCTVQMGSSQCERDVERCRSWASLLMAANAKSTAAMSQTSYNSSCTSSPAACKQVFVVPMAILTETWGTPLKIPVQVKLAVTRKLVWLGWCIRAYDEVYVWLSLPSHKIHTLYRISCTFSQPQRQPPKEYGLGTGVEPGGWGLGKVIKTHSNLKQHQILKYTSIP